MPDTAVLAQEAQELVAAAGRRKRAAAATPRRRRGKPAPVSVVAEEAAAAHPASAQDAPRRGGRRLTWCLPMVAASLVLVLAGLGWQRAPQLPGLANIDVVGAEVPRELLRRWLLAFPERQALAGSGAPDLLRALRDHLLAQPAVAEVRSVSAVWLADGADLHRGLVIDLRLRQPVLPVRRQGGRIDWVDAAGRVLPGELAGPDGEPRVHGIELADPAALGEVLVVWPQLREALLALETDGRFRFGGRAVDRILLHEPLNARGDHGIVFVLGDPSDTRLVWGAPGEERFGLDSATKIRHLVHTLTCQGSRGEDLGPVAEINVRFPGPFAVVPRRGTAD